MEKARSSIRPAFARLPVRGSSTPIRVLPAARAVDSSGISHRKPQKRTQERRKVSLVRIVIKSGISLLGKES
jgi:hypothetical protein